MRLELRPGLDTDLPFLWRLQCEAMRPNVERQFGPWDEAFQRESFDASTDPTAHEIVELDGRAIGCQWVRWLPDAAEIERLHLLPEFHQRGIGTRLVEAVIARASAKGLPVRLQVFRTSPARRLYERLRFRVVARSESHETMERSAALPPGDRM